MDHLRIPRRRPARRFYRDRTGKRPGILRHGRTIRCCLLILAACCLSAFTASAIRSARTAASNAAFAGWKEEADARFPTAAPRPEIRLERMTKADGSPITREEKQRAGLRPADIVTSTIYHKASGDPLPAMEELRKQNRDLIAWLEIDGVLDLPVVYRDNEWYLNHDFEGRKSPSGTLFLDKAHPLTEQNQTLLIHGHNMKDGSMFAQLTHYQEADWCRRHSVIHLTTLWEKEMYMVFAVLRTATDPASPDYVNFFTHPHFATDQEFDDYIHLLEARSCFHSGLTIRPGDALLELSTCIGADRLVVVARRLDANETVNTALFSQRSTKR